LCLLQSIMCTLCLVVLCVVLMLFDALTELICFCFSFPNQFVFCPYKLGLLQQRLLLRTNATQSSSMGKIVERMPTLNAIEPIKIYRLHILVFCNVFSWQRWTSSRFGNNRQNQQQR
jgi:hypothetical protein